MNKIKTLSQINLFYQKGFFKACLNKSIITDNLTYPLQKEKESIVLSTTGINHGYASLSKVISLKSGYTNF